MKFEKVSEIASCLAVRVEEESFIRKFGFDSRLVEQGELFFALKGERSDGHDFLSEVAYRGGVAAVVDRRYRGNHPGLSLLKVDNVVAALQQLASHLQRQRRQKVIAVTGSVGKTTTKEFIVTLLQGKFSVDNLSSNSQVGLPLAILNSSGEGEWCVAEMGMSHSGQIARLVQIITPEIGVVTRIGHAHIQSFPDGIEAIAAAKAELFSHPSTKIGIINRQALLFNAFRHLNQISISSYSNEEDADFSLNREGIFSEKGILYPEIRSPFLETHLSEDFLAAVAVARKLGLSSKEISSRIAALQTREGRFNRVVVGGALFIDDSYNASPESMKAAIKNLPSPPGPSGKLIAVLGEMRELGAYHLESHRSVAALAIERVDHLFCYGENCWPNIEFFGQRAGAVQFFTDLDQLRRALFNLVKKGDLVLIKGSNAHGLYRLLPTSIR